MNKNRRSNNHQAVQMVTMMTVGLCLLASSARAVEVLSAAELSSHCAFLASEPDSADGQYCIRYIQGFIDGAVATDARVMLAADEEREESFLERAARTRVPSRTDHLRAAQLAGFCLGDPLPLLDVVNVVVEDLEAVGLQAGAELSARDVVYSSLREHYSCEISEEAPQA